MTMRSMYVRDYLSADLITLTPDMDILQADRVLIDNNISGAPVVDESGGLVGILTERDILASAVQAYYYGNRGGLVREYMVKEPQCVAPDDSLMEVARLFIDGRYHRYPVVDDDRLVGIISRSDLMRALREYYPT